MKIAPNWGGIPPPTFSPGPRSTVSRISAGHPAPLSSTQANEARSGDALGGCKPSNPSFVPSPQSAPDSHAVPAVSSASLASNFGWNASGVPTTSAAMPQGNGNSSMPNGPSPQPISSNPSDKAAAPTSPQAGINHAVNGQDAIHSPPASGWSNRETASTNGGGPTQAVIASNPPNQATYQQAAPQTISNAAAFGWNVKQPASNAGMAPLPQAPQREQTPRPASSFHNVCFALFSQREIIA